jgi:aminopeptidase N
MPSLNRDEAVVRAELLRVDQYDIDLDLRAAPDGEPFESTTTIRFSCTRPGASTFVDVQPLSIVEARLNGVELDPARFADGRLTLSDLAADNVLVVRAQMAYSNSGEGIHRSVDPEDGEVYLYAQAGPDRAPLIFACFDQPDLKARLHLQVSAPVDWVVHANGAGHRSEPDRWDFAQTPPVSTYLMTVVAGPYHVVSTEHDGIALGLVGRRSQASHLDREAAELFELTRASLDRYHELFGIRYPFGKYDQAFVPECNWGAMENPGCVVFRDEFLFPSSVTEADREHRAVVLAHEMAHMWFGNLVTLRWWDDIWLNESFAELMGWWVTADVTRFRHAWSTFAVRRKGSGYAADQRPSTHPVAPDSVTDVGLALQHFDGISYAKGASVLRQLMAWLGEKPFIEGLRAYLNAHAFGNATLADLMQALAAASGRDLTEWAEVWLRRTGVNTLRAQASLDAEGRYEAITIEQSAPPPEATLRPHRIGVGVYDGDAAIELVRRVEVDLDPAVDHGRTAVAGLTGVRAGRLLLPNDGDLTFAKLRLPAQNMADLVGVLPNLSDPLARAVCWAMATDATRDGELTGAEFIALVVAALPVETEVPIFAEVLRFATAFVANRYLPSDVRAIALPMLANVCARTLLVAQPGSGRQLAAARGLTGCAGLSEAPTLTNWLAGTDVPDGLVVDAALRWAALYRLVALGSVDEAGIADEVNRDRSASGEEQAARCRAALPTVSAKAQAWDFVMGSVGSVRLVSATAQGFWQPEQDAITSEYVSRYFTDLPALAANRSSQMAVHYAAEFAFPRFAITPATVTAAEALLARDLEPIVRRVVLDETDELRRSLAARLLAAEASNAARRR